MIYIIIYLITKTLFPWDCFRCKWVWTILVEIFLFLSLLIYQQCIVLIYETSSSCSLSFFFLLTRDSTYTYMYTYQLFSLLLVKVIKDSKLKNIKKANMISYICSIYVCYTYFIRIFEEVPLNLFYDFRKFLIVLKLVSAFFFFMSLVWVWAKVSI